MDKRLQSAWPRPHLTQLAGPQISFFFTPSTSAHLAPLLTRCTHVAALAVKLNGNRTVQGTLRGFDQFMNLVLDETMEIVCAPARTTAPFCTRM